MQATDPIIRFPSLRSAKPRRALMALGMGLALTLSPLAGAVQAQGVPPSFADHVEKFSPAVVDITTSSIVAAQAGGQMQVHRALRLRSSSRISMAQMASRPQTSSQWSGLRLWGLATSSRLMVTS